MEATYTMFGREKFLQATSLCQLSLNLVFSDVCGRDP